MLSEYVKTLDDKKLLGYYLTRTFEGDDVMEEGYELLRKLGYLTDADEWDYGDDD